MVGIGVVRRAEVGHNMVGIGVVRGVGIFPWPNSPLIPNHIITSVKATNATAMTKSKTYRGEFLRSGMGENSADGTRSEINRSGSSGSSTAYAIV